MSYTRLRYHIVTATKYREMVITPEVEAVLYPALQNKAVEQGGKVIAVGGVEDHIHVIAAIPPTVALATFVQKVKNGSSRAVNITTLLEGDFSWQRGYGAFTLNPNALSDVIHYVKNQKWHHAEKVLWENYEKC